ncbi:hypothetical protein TSTA_091550 [Talaromyces stipitatus ATCC 10500]|uniref:Uncharacterized protein n=1 Tax=Talaromyces stipitatus (strain ATCC 10500 / CBS 375.48 / QM 6759 / NRRL 1006) TaxID=441959 RepID=B8M2K3_TALSN|nr:uncharacterized protein TSTA_091550 [Talaromyces stipitatus ATCC 10500]EED21914.1 hypothetical protein TSTA_091550 [Talaromyces stipitatus ATCC 10500]
MRRNFVTAVGASLAGPMPVNPSLGSRSIVCVELYGIFDTSDLRKAAETRIGCLKSKSDEKDLAGVNWSWPVESFERFDAYAVWNDLHPFLVEHIWTVGAVLEGLGLRPSSSPYRRSDQQEQQESSIRAAWHSNPETPMPLFLSFDLLTTLAMITTTRPGSNFPPPAAEKIPVTVFLTSTFKVLQRALIADDVFHSLGMALSRARSAVTGMVEFQPYRRLGVLLWDKWRMYSVGLMPNTAQMRVPTPDGGFIEVNDNRETIQELQARWLASVGKKL